MSGRRKNAPPTSEPSQTSFLASGHRLLLFQIPTANAQHKTHDLRISVPSGLLDEAIEASDNLLPTYIGAQVSQLPTPVMYDGEFPSMFVPPKRSAFASNSAGTSRIVLEFIPVNYDKARMPDSPKPNRNVSNPLYDGTLDTMQTISLPPLDDETTVVTELLYSPAMSSYFVPGRVLGVGSFSKVVEARQATDPGRVVAVKIIVVPTDDVVAITNFRSYITSELGILTHLSHPCVIKLYDYNVTMNITPQQINDYFSAVSASRSDHSLSPSDSNGSGTIDELLYDGLPESNNQCYFLQYCPGGNLLQYLEQHYKVLMHETQFWRFVTRVCAELIAVVSYLHMHRVVHRDIKLENILLNQKLDASTDYTCVASSSEALVTLNDFGLSKRIVSYDQRLTTKCGSQDYVSPELLMRLDYDGMLLDSWAVGVVIYAMLENRLPFDAPPLEFMEASNISPCVIKRRRNRHNPWYRIAMIDWNWYHALALLDSPASNETKTHVRNLMAVVDALLVRQEKRRPVTDLLHDKNFFWIREVLPPSVLEFDCIQRDEAVFDSSVS